MGRDFSSIFLKLESSARLIQGISPDLGPSIASIKFNGPSSSYTDATSTFDALNNIASTSTRYTIIDITDKSEPDSLSPEPVSHVNIIAHGKATGRVDGQWSLSDSINCKIEGFGQGGFNIFLTGGVSIEKSIITLGESAVESVLRLENSFKVNTQDGNKDVYFVITKNSE